MSVHPLKQTEKGFQQTVIELAHLYKWRVAHFRSAQTVNGWRTPVAADGAGFPDLFMVKGDKAIAMELKVGYNKTSEKQDEWLDALDKAGIPSYVLRPDDMPLIRELLSA